MNDLLKPCPYCGSQWEIEVGTGWDSMDGVNGRWGAQVHCKDCQANGPELSGVSEEDARIKAVGRWNKVSRDVVRAKNTQRKEETQLRADKAKLQHILAELPEESVIEKMSLEARLGRVESRLQEIQQGEQDNEHEG